MASGLMGTIQRSQDLEKTRSSVTPGFRKISLNSLSPLFQETRKKPWDAPEDGQTCSNYGLSCLGDGNVLIFSFIPVFRQTDWSLRAFLHWQRSDRLYELHDRIDKVFIAVKKFRYGFSQDSLDTLLFLIFCHSVFSHRPHPPTCILSLCWY